MVGYFTHRGTITCAQHTCFLFIPFHSGIQFSQRRRFFCAQEIIHLRIAYILLSFVSDQRYVFPFTRVSNFRNVVASFAHRRSLYMISVFFSRGPANGIALAELLYLGFNFFTWVLVSLLGEVFLYFGLNFFIRTSICQFLYFYILDAFVLISLLLK